MRSSSGLAFRALRASIASMIILLFPLMTFGRPVEEVMVKVIGLSGMTGSTEVMITGDALLFPTETTLFFNHGLTARLVVEGAAAAAAVQFVGRDSWTKKEEICAPASSAALDSAIRFTSKGKSMDTGSLQTTVRPSMTSVVLYPDFASVSGQNS